MKKIMLAMVVWGIVFSANIYARQDPNTPPAKETPKNPVVKIATTKGDIWVELEAQKAPISVANFLAYTKDGFYNGTIFHRVIKNFMIQGGGMTPDMRPKKTKPPIKNEAANGLKNKRGTIAMARTNVPDSATSQFFINHKDNAFLDFRDPSPRGIGYAVFGKVIKGMDVVDAIAVTPTRPGDVPVEPIVIESVTLVENKEPKADDSKQTEKKDDNKTEKP
jgi:cyclophilin family peptidyl-prolyl cis-trans isomerase